MNQGQTFAGSVEPYPFSLEGNVNSCSRRSIFECFQQQMRATVFLCLVPRASSFNSLQNIKCLPDFLFFREAL